MTDPALALPMDVLLQDARRVIMAGQRALALLNDSLDADLLHAARIVASCEGRILVSGMGKSGIAARKLAATLCSLGIAAQFLHAGDALHGDMGAILGGDVLIVISVSGSTSELLPLVHHARYVGAATVAVTANTQAPLALGCERILLLPMCEEGAGQLVAPMASTVATIALGDALAVLAASCRGRRPDHMARLHPAGDLGRRLHPVRRIMHGGDRVPIVPESAAPGEIVAEITGKGFGITGVADDQGRLIGTISDGDLRRHFGDLHGRTARDLMVAEPVTLDADGDVGGALDLVRTHRISTLFVIDAGSARVAGVVHLQDLLRVGVL